MSEATVAEHANDVLRAQMTRGLTLVMLQLQWQKDDPDDLRAELECVVRRAEPGELEAWVEAAPYLIRLSLERVRPKEREGYLALQRRIEEIAAERGLPCPRLLSE